MSFFVMGSLQYYQAKYVENYVETGNGGNGHKNVQYELIIDKNMDISCASQFTVPDGTGPPVPDGIMLRNIGYVTNIISTIELPEHAIISVQINGEPTHYSFPLSFAKMICGPVKILNNPIYKYALKVSDDTIFFQYELPSKLRLMFNKLQGNNIKYILSNIGDIGSPSIKFGILFQDRTELLRLYEHGFVFDEDKQIFVEPILTETVDITHHINRHYVCGMIIQFPDTKTINDISFIKIIDDTQGESPLKVPVGTCNVIYTINKPVRNYIDVIGGKVCLNIPFGSKNILKVCDSYECTEKLLEFLDISGPTHLEITNTSGEKISGYTVIEFRYNGLNYTSDGKIEFKYN